MSDPVNYEDVFRAILAMDVYSRGPNNILSSAKLGVQVGTATLTHISDQNLETDFGFVAAEYTTENGKIYSYRGTDRALR